MDNNLRRRFDVRISMDEVPIVNLSQNQCCHLESPIKLMRIHVIKFETGNLGKWRNEWKRFERGKYEIWDEIINRKTLALARFRLSKGMCHIYTWWLSCVDIKNTSGASRDPHAWHHVNYTWPVWTHVSLLSLSLFLSLPNSNSNESSVAVTHCIKERGNWQFGTTQKHTLNIWRSLSHRSRVHVERKRSLDFWDPRMSELPTSCCSMHASITRFPFFLR